MSTQQMHIHPYGASRGLTASVSIAFCKATRASFNGAFWVSKTARAASWKPAALGTEQQIGKEVVRLNKGKININVNSGLIDNGLPIRGVLLQ